MYNTDLDRCYICDSAPADIPFKGKIICEDCLQAVKAYCTKMRTSSL